MRINILLFFFFLLGNLFSQHVTIDNIQYDTVSPITQRHQILTDDYPHMQCVDDNLPEDMLAIEGINYKTVSPSRSLSLSVYRRNDGRQLPAVMMIHSGAWHSGSPSMQKMLAIHLAQKGFVAIVPEYRLTEEAIYPAAVEDLIDALKWIGRNAKKSGIDNTKIAVSGCGAGGQIAALLGLKNESKNIQAVINIDGVSTFMDLQTTKKAREAAEAGKALPENARWLGGTRDEAYDNWQNASPLYHIHKYSAPVCFINSALESYRVGRDEVIRQLQALDIVSEEHLLADAPHWFWLFHPWHQRTVNYMANFLEKIFRPLTPIKNKKYDMVVAQDDSGDFRTVQEAIDAVPDFGQKNTTVFIRRGIYQEKIIIPDTKENLSLIGEDAQNTVLSFNNFPAKKNRWGNPLGESGAASVYVCPAYFSAENLTFENASFVSENAIAIMICSPDARFTNCRFVGVKKRLEER